MLGRYASSFYTLLWKTIVNEYIVRTMKCMLIASNADANLCLTLHGLTVANTDSRMFLRPLSLVNICCVYVVELVGNYITLQYTL